MSGHGTGPQAQAAGWRRRPVKPEMLCSWLRGPVAQRLPCCLVALGRGRCGEKGDLPVRLRGLNPGVPLHLHKEDPRCLDPQRSCPETVWPPAPFPEWISPRVGVQGGGSKAHGGPGGVAWGGEARSCGPECGRALTSAGSAT